MSDAIKSLAATFYYGTHRINIVHVVFHCKTYIHFLNLFVVVYSIHCIQNFLFCFSRVNFQILNVIKISFKCHTYAVLLNILNTFDGVNVFRNWKTISMYFWKLFYHIVISLNNVELKLTYKAKIKNIGILIGPWNLFCFI